MATGIQKKWLAGVVGALAAILLVAFMVETSNHTDRQRPENNAPADESNAAVERGMLKLWVPAGWTGDDYWVYLNGQLVSAPPHGSSRNYFPFSGKTQDESNRDNGWKILTDVYGNGGTVLAIRHGYFLDTENYRTYVVSGDRKGLFYPVNLPLQSGRYTVEIAYLSNNTYQSSFPFAISPKYDANVQAGGRTELHIGVPDDWVDHVVAGAARPPRSCDAKPDVSYLTKEMNTYLEDPVAQALTSLQASSNSGGSVLLDLPSAQGGAREYDSSQIRYMANAVLENYYTIVQEVDHSHLDECKSSHPEWSSSLDEYGKMLSDIKNELQPIHALAGK